MQSTKAFTRLRPISSKLIKHPQTILNTHRPRKMSLFPRYASYSAPFDNSFRSLFRAVDDLASNYDSLNSSSTAIRAFSPKFDVVEVEGAYNLHGELPGLDQKDISIEFTDPHTLVIKGRTETRYESSPDDEGEAGNNNRITDASHKPTVEDEQEASQKEQNGTSTAVATQDSNKKSDVVNAGQNKTRYWVSERSVGEFHRSFSFPTRVDQDGVKASLKQGVLSIVVPKLTASKGSRRINIEAAE